MSSRLSKLRASLLANRLSIIGFVVVGLFCVTAILTGVAGDRITPYRVFTTNYNYSNSNFPPSFSHPMGTGFNGVDIFSQVLVALPIDLGIPLLVVFISCVLGLVLGTIAGYFGGALDEAIMRLTDMFLAFPVLILALAVAATLGPSLINVIISLTVTWWPPYVRLVRGQVLQISTEDFVAISKSLNSSFSYILRRDILPNVLPSILVYATLDVGTALLSLSTLGFLNVGIPQNVPELGKMVSSISYNLYTYPWEAILPALVVMVMVVGFSFLGEGLRESLDVSLRPHILFRKKRAEGSTGTAVPAQPELRP